MIDGCYRRHNHCCGGDNYMLVAEPYAVVSTDNNCTDWRPWKPDAPNWEPIAIPKERAEVWFTFYYDGQKWTCPEVY